jgi:hypothetical protein
MWRGKRQVLRKMRKAWKENRQVWRGKRRCGGDETSEKGKETGAEGVKADRLKQEIQVRDRKGGEKYIKVLSVGRGDRDGTAGYDAGRGIRESGIERHRQEWGGGGIGGRGGKGKGEGGGWLISQGTPSENNVIGIYHKKTLICVSGKKGRR